MAEDNKKPKILIVEDDVKLGKTLSDVLKAKGYSPVAVLTGKEGVAAVKEKDISLALLDLKLPAISGIGVLKEIKKNSPRTEVIILTAFASLDTATEAVNMGAFSYLQKPYAIEHLLLNIRRALERKWAEEALRESEEKYREVVKTSVDGVISVDSQMKVGVWNKGAERLFGYTEEEMLGQSLMKIVPERYRKAMEKGFIEFRKSGSGPVIGKTLELEGVRKDGIGIPVELSVSSRKMGETYIATAIVRDITKRKAMEDALHAAYEKLKEEDKMKTDFLTVAYHEMGTPLTPIVGYTSLLERTKLNEKQKKYVRIIAESATQLEELITSLLEVTRIEAGKVELTLEPVSIPEILKSVLERFKPQVDAKRQTISTVVPEGTEIEGDKQKITAIFDNLISNAIKYAGEKGRIDIVVEDRKKEEEIRVCVADTGIGISEAQLPRVFERFYTVDTLLAGKRGLGLGLAIVKGYVKLHGGEVWVTSELGKGSKFWFTLPKRQR